MWYLRKFYAGNNGALPPTDPRILSMTEAQIDVEFEHILLDKAERDAASGAKVYVDDEYEKEEAEEERVDSKIFMDYDDFEDEDDEIPLPKSENDDNEDEWVDVETDDDDFEDDFE